MQHYKSRVDATETEQVAALVGVFMTLHSFAAHHESCLAAKVGLTTDRFDLVVAAPSSNAHVDNSHLQRLVDLMPGFDGRVIRGLTATARGRTEHKSPSAERFTLSETMAGVEGKSVLIIDDVWTTGATVRSCALALAEGGANTIGAMVIERFLKPDRWPPTEQNIEAVKQTGFDGCCTICR